MVPRPAKGAPVLIAGETVKPGTRRAIEIPVARLPTGTMVHLPVVVMAGRRAGPRLWLSAAIHGDEINGVEVIRRVLSGIKVTELTGSIVAVPVVNIFGFIEGTRYLPDRRDLNRSFPGSGKGSLAGQLADLFMREIVRGSDCGIDLHTAAQTRTNLPQIRADLDMEATVDFAEAFGAPVSIHARLRDGSLREAAAQEGIPTLLYEGGEPNRFNRWAIEAGVRGVRRVLTHLNMVETGEDRPELTTVFSRSTRWVRASRGGILRLDVELGDHVSTGERLGFLGNLLTSTGRSVRAPVSGVVIGHATTPLVNKGDALVHIAQID